MKFSIKILPLFSRSTGFVILSAFSVVYAQSERYCNEQFCKSVNGVTERKYNYRDTWISVDCETDDKVYEAGMDTQSSLDNIQQATFAGHLTGKKEVVVIFDTDGNEGHIEYQIRWACKRWGIEYQVFRCEY